MSSKRKLGIVASTPLAERGLIPLQLNVFRECSTYRKCIRADCAFRFISAQLLEADVLFESGEPELALVRYHCGRRSVPGHAGFAAGVRRCEGVIKLLASKDVLRKMQEHATCPERCWET